MSLAFHRLHWEITCRHRVEDSPYSTGNAFPFPKASRKRLR